MRNFLEIAKNWTTQAMRLDEQPFKQLLKDLKITQTWLASAIGWDTGKMSHMVTGQRRVTDADLHRITKALKIPKTDIPLRHDDLELDIYREEKLFQEYENLSTGHIVSIVSRDGFIEANDLFYWERMLELVNRGVVVRYFYPSQIGKNDQDAYARDCVRDLLALRHRCRHSNVPADQVQFFRVRPQGDSLFGGFARQIAISMWTGKSRRKQKLLSLFNFVLTGGHPTEGGRTVTSDVKAWIRIHADVATQYFLELLGYAHPISEIGMYENRLDSTIQESYRRQFASYETLAAYSNLRKRLKTSDFLKEIIRRIKPVVERVDDEFRLLDIGSGDGHVLSELLKQIRNIQKPFTKIQITSVESSDVRLDDKKDYRDDAGVTPVGSTFEEYFAPEGVFDCITAIHSLYLIDPSYIKKIYELLSDQGVAVIVTSPFDGNLINQFCHHLDKALASGSRSLIKFRPYPQKKIPESPFRCFGEDTLDACQSFFGRDAVCLQEIPEELQFSQEEQEVVTKELFAVFGDGRLRDAETETIRQSLLSPYSSNKENRLSITTNNWILTISKSQLGKLHGTVHGTI